MSLNSTSFIQTLINSGADASLNLFEFTFQPQKGDDLTTVKETFSCRVTQIANLYQRDNTTTEIGYQNISIPVINTGTQMMRTLGFNIRIDEDFYVYNKLRQLQSIDNFGNIIFDKNKLVDITVRPLRPATNGTYYYGTYQWKFHDCYIYSLSALTFEYASATTGNTSANFIWSYCEEGLIDEEGDYNSALATTNAQTANEKGKALTQYYKLQQEKQAQVAQSRAEEQAEAELHNSAFDSYMTQSQAIALRDNEKGKATTEYYQNQNNTISTKNAWATANESVYEANRAKKIESIIEPTKSSGSNYAKNVAITTLSGLFSGKSYEAGEAERAKESIKSQTSTTILNNTSSALKTLGQLSQL